LRQSPASVKKSVAIVGTKLEVVEGKTRVVMQPSSFFGNANDDLASAKNSDAEQMAAFYDGGQSTGESGQHPLSRVIDKPAQSATGDLANRQGSSDEEAAALAALVTRAGIPRLVTTGDDQLPLESSVFQGMKLVYIRDGFMLFDNRLNGAVRSPDIKRQGRVEDRDRATRSGDHTPYDDSGGNLACPKHGQVYYGLLKN
jgi:hypothetical protein